MYSQLTQVIYQATEWGLVLIYHNATRRHDAAPDICATIFFPTCWSTSGLKRAKGNVA